MGLILLNTFKNGSFTKDNLELKSHSGAWEPPSFSPPLGSYWILGV